MYRISFTGYELFITDGRTIPCIKNDKLKLVYKDKTTNITFDIYQSIFRREGEFSLSFYKLNENRTFFNKEWTTQYKGKYSDILNIIKDCKLLIYKTNEAD